MDAQVFAPDDCDERHGIKHLHASLEQLLVELVETLLAESEMLSCLA